MTKDTIKQIAILSAILGIILGIITLIPFIGQLSFLLLMCFVSVLIIWFMLKVELLDITTNKQSVVLGAFIGFISFITFSIIYLPSVAILGKLFNLYEFYGVSVFLSLKSFGIITILVLFMGILSATINAFTGFLTYYCFEFLKSVNEEKENSKKLFSDKQPTQKKINSPFNNSNNDFKL